jgi:hypothetical protein
MASRTGGSYGSGCASPDLVFRLMAAALGATEAGPELASASALHVIDATGNLGNPASVQRLDDELGKAS